MRLLTFSVLRNCKFKLLGAQGRRLADLRPRPEADGPTRLIGDPKLLEVCPTWPASEQPGLRAAVLRDMAVLPDFVSEAEEAALLAELEPVFKRMRYEHDHWDDAIHGYRETERRSWRPENELVVARVRGLVWGQGGGQGAVEGAGEPLAHAHVLDLAPSGHIKPHIDAKRYCGEVIAGLCLSSSAVMELVNETHKHLALRAMLPRRCLYVMRGVARHSFTHAVLGNEQSTFRGTRVLKRRRIAVICRSAPPPPDAPELPKGLPESLRP